MPPGGMLHGVISMSLILLVSKGGWLGVHLLDVEQQQCDQMDVTF
jgi:hypothetical protein